MSFERARPAYAVIKDTLARRIGDGTLAEGTVLLEGPLAELFRSSRSPVKQAFAQLDLRSIKISPKMAEAVHGLSCPEPVVATLGYREPSLVFLVGTRLDLFETGPEAAQFLKSHPCSIVFVERRFEGAFRDEAARLQLQPALSTRVTGFNINGGRRLDLGAYAVSP